jgi:hypothetical protein
MRWSRSDTVRAIDGIAFTVGMLIPLFWLDARATEKPTPPAEQTQEQHQSQTVTAGGGQGGGASNQLAIGGDRSTAIGLAHGAPTPPVCPNGLVPGRGKSRGHGSPLYSISATCEAPDEAQAAAIQGAREHELAIARLAVQAARAEAERDRVATDRIRAEACRAGCVAK